MSDQENTPPAGGGADEIEMMSAEDLPQQNGKSVVITKAEDGADAEENGAKEGAEEVDDDCKQLNVFVAKLAARNTRKMNVIKRNSEFFVKSYEVQKDNKRDQMNITDVGEDQNVPKQL